MKRRLVIGVIVLLLIGGGAAAYFTTKDNDTTTPSTSQTSGGQSANGANFNPASTEDLEFTATITTAGAGSATFEHDDKGSTRYVATQNGQQIEVVYTSDAYYSCQGDNCVKFPISQSSNSGFNPGDYTYDQTELANYRSSSSYKGKQSCPSGTCDVWSVSVSGNTSTIYIDADTKRITQVESTIAGKTSKIVYEYKDVTIDIPANAQTIPTPSP
ncbi:MAG TPA: hypothetical protein VIK37_02795 [Candidatus Saccharimonadales bacterium]